MGEGLQRAVKAARATHVRQAMLTHQEYTRLIALVKAAANSAPEDNAILNKLCAARDRFTTRPEAIR